MKNTLKGFGAALCVALPFLMQAPAQAADQALVQRGAYLAKVGDCVACHTAPKGKPFAGGLPMTTPMGQIYTTNITPDPDTGIGKWSVEEIADYLGSGNKPDGDVAGGLMAEVIDGTLAGYKDLTQADRVAIAQYLKTLPPIRNKIGK